MSLPILMPSIADWAPNLHPLLVHFPIGLLFTAAIFDLFGLFAGQRPFLRQVALLLYVAGAALTFAVYYTGMQAADSVFLPTEANALMTEHDELGSWTMYYFTAYALVRLALSFGKAVKMAGIRFLLFLLGAGGVALMTVTAHHGAELVFRYGVGIEAVENRPLEPAVATDSTVVDDGGVVAGDSVWTWTPTRAATWASSFAWLDGTVDTVSPSMVDAGERGDVLAFDLDGTVAFLATTGSFRDLQIDTDLDLSRFDGSVMVAYDIVDASNFRFASFGTSGVRVGRSENGDLLIDGSGEFDGSGWRSLRVVADQGHYRAYVDTEMAAHAHAANGPGGPVGLRFNGKGRVRIGHMTITSLR